MTEKRRPILTRSQISRELLKLGLRPDGALMVHASVRSLGWIVGGPDTVINGLLDALGPDGTLMMYVSWEEWENALVFGVNGMDNERRKAYLAECPPFNPATSRATRSWSILTEYLRTWPGAYRSNHPTASVVAVGAKAKWLTADHPLAYGYGAGSPFEKLRKAGGQVLLLGAPLNSLSILHHAEHMANILRKKVVQNTLPVLEQGKVTWIKFEEFDTCEGIREGFSGEDYFTSIAQEYLSSGKGQTGTVGAAECHLFPVDDLVRFAIEWMEAAWGKG